jgi:hypothetical protein
VLRQPAVFLSGIIPALCAKSLQRASAKVENEICDPLPRFSEGHMTAPHLLLKSKKSQFLYL